jgi:hypothetical protein
MNMADKKAQLPGEPLLDYIARIGHWRICKKKTIARKGCKQT